MANFSLFKGFPGILRIFTLVFGFLVLGLSAYFHDKGIRCFYGAQDEDTVRLWRVLLAIAIITFIVSLTWVVLFILGVIVDSGCTKTTDMVWHIMGGVLLIIGGIIWFIAEFQTTRPERSKYELELCSGTQVFFVIVTGIFGLVDGCVYLAVAFFVWKSSGGS